MTGDENLHTAPGNRTVLAQRSVRTVRTVLGDVPPSLLGRVNYHEHLFQVSPLLPDDDLDSEEASGQEAVLLRASGFQTMVDATPIGLGRRPAALARISAAAGLTVIATTGRHREAHYGEADPIRRYTGETLAERCIADLTAGMPARDEAGPGDAKPRHGLASPGVPELGAKPVRAGILKAGIDYWRISAFERTTLEAVAAAHRATGAAVMVHLEWCTAAHEVLDLLGALGVLADRVVLAHADRTPDAGLHTELAARGAYLGYDGAARHRMHGDHVLIELTERVVAAGHGDRLLLGGDVARRSRYAAYGGMPGLAYLGDRYVPRLRERLGDAAVEQLLVANPARFLPLGPDAGAAAPDAPAHS